MLVREYFVVNELLHLLDVYPVSPQNVHCGVLPVAYDSQEQVVRSDAVAACPHGLFAREVDD